MGGAGARRGALRPSWPLHPLQLPPPVVSGRGGVGQGPFLNTRLLNSMRGPASAAAAAGYDNESRRRALRDGLLQHALLSAQ